MLEIIVKRDGTEEPFAPAKLNHWGMWGAKKLGDRVNWSKYVIGATVDAPQKMTSQDLQLRLIKQGLLDKTWAGNLFSGRLYAPYLHKLLYGGEHLIPTPKELFTKLAAPELRLMRPMNYTDADWHAAAQIINHSRDFNYAHFQLDQLRSKYAIQNRTTGEEYESAQFIFLRMAMALAEDEPVDTRMTHVREWYDHFSLNRINCPSPNYINLGTHLRGFASCCVYAVNDNIESLSIGDHIAYRMTAMSAGIGAMLGVRSLNEPVRGGAIAHQGKLGYFRAQAAATKANKQAGRGGALTSYYAMYDPESPVIMELQNPRSVDTRKNRDLHFAMQMNANIQRLIEEGRQMFHFSCKTAPDLWKKFFSEDKQGFADLYDKYEADPTFKKQYSDPRKLLIQATTQSHEVATHYFTWIDEMNRHTPFRTTKEPIRSSNLCTEVMEPTQGYDNMMDLLTPADNGFVMLKVLFEGEEKPTTTRMAWSDKVWITRPHTNEKYVSFAGDAEPGDEIRYENKGVEIEFEVLEIIESVQSSEVAMCSLAALVIPNLPTDALYRSAAYYALKMIDKTIHISDYPLAHIGYTAKQRMNAGVGVIGVATIMAQKNLKYSSQEGRTEQFKMAERHMYHLIEASLLISQERGLAPWIHKTKWPQGWLPIDTGNKEVLKLVNCGYSYAWEPLRARIIANGGIAHSVLCNLMPTESSSKASGYPNCMYPVKQLAGMKSDESNVIDWVAFDNDLIGPQYEIAYDVTRVEMLKSYCVWQYFIDQGISAEIYADRVKNPTLSTKDMLLENKVSVKYGMKSRYYMTSKINKKKATGGVVAAPAAGVAAPSPMDLIAAAARAQQDAAYAETDGFHEGFAKPEFTDLGALGMPSEDSVMSVDCAGACML